MEKLEAFKLFATKCSYFQILATEASVEMSCIMKKDVIMRNLLYLLKWLGNVERVMSSKLITEFTLFRNSLQTRFSGYFQFWIFCLFSHAKIIGPSMAVYPDFIYRTRSIIIRGLYIFYLLFKSPKHFFQGVFFSENSAFM